MNHPAPGVTPEEEARDEREEVQLEADRDEHEHGGEGRYDRREDRREQREERDDEEGRHVDGDDVEPERHRLRALELHRVSGGKLLGVDDRAVLDCAE